MAHKVRHRRHKTRHASRPSHTGKTVRTTKVSPHHTVGAHSAPPIVHTTTSHPSNNKPAAHYANVMHGIPHSVQSTPHQSTSDLIGNGRTRMSMTEAKLASTHYVSNNNPQPVKHLFPEMGKELQTQGNNIVSGWSRAWNTVSSWFGG